MSGMSISEGDDPSLVTDSDDETDYEVKCFFYLERIFPEQGVKGMTCYEWAAKERKRPIFRNSVHIGVRPRRA